MKRAISLVLCLVLICGAFTVSVSAAEDYYVVFHPEIHKLWWSVAFSGEDNISEFSPKHIKWYTNYKVNIYDYDFYDEEIDYGYGSYFLRYYMIPADVYESEAKKYFNISDINALRNDTDHDPVYNAETNTYDMPDAGGFGDSVTYLTKGYKYLGSRKYEVYGYTVEQAYEKPDDAVEGVDYVMNYDYPVEILKCHKITIRYDGTDVKFLSWETISVDEMPVDSDLIIHTHTLSSWIIDLEATVYSSGYKYKECTACGDAFEFTEIPQLKCSKPTLKSIENTEYGVLLKWKTVEGADSYRVYRKTSKTDWEYIASTSKTYYTDKTAESGTKYYYAVRAKNEAGLSSYSGSLSKYYLEDPTLNTPSTTTKGVGLRWSKVNGAEGYAVYRRTADGSYKRIATEKGVSNVTFRDTTAQKGTKYYYRVKAYYSKTYGAYSNTKSITDKY